MCPGICKDRLADAFERFGRVPIEKRKLVVPPDHSAFRTAEDPFWSAGGLLHDGHGRVLLIRHVAAAGWGDAWVTPGGRMEEGEAALAGVRREVRDEVGMAGRDRGTEAGAARRRHSERLLPGWGARSAGRRCDYSARESDHRALRTPRAARPVHPGLASTRHETLQGIWGRLACTLRARDEGRSIPWRP